MSQIFLHDIFGPPFESEANSLEFQIVKRRERKTKKRGMGIAQNSYLNNQYSVSCAVRQFLK